MRAQATTAVILTCLLLMASVVSTGQELNDEVERAHIGPNTTTTAWGVSYDWSELPSDIKMRPVTFCHDTESVDLALDILLDRREQIMVVKDEFGTTRGLLSMEDIIETLLGVEIVDEADLDAIEEVTTAEDLREIAKEKFGHTNDENEQQNGE